MPEGTSHVLHDLDLYAPVPHLDIRTIAGIGSHQSGFRMEFF